MEHIASYRIDEQGIAVLTIDMKDWPTNLMNAQSTPAIYGKLLEALANPEVKGAIICSGKRDFFAGGDLQWMLSFQSPESVFAWVNEGHALMRKAETLGKPMVAAIAGNALGGGYEIALNCHYRIALDNPSISIGLPETKLGLLPGAGGTQRLPWLVGIAKAMPLILQAKTLSPAIALKEGLVNELASSEDELMARAKAWILANPTARQPWDDPKGKMPGGGVMQQQPIFSGSIAMGLKETKGNYPSIGYAMAAMYNGLQLPIDRGLLTEARYFTKAVFSKEARNLIQTGFFAINNANKGKARPSGIEKTTFKKIGILGAGLMGAGIAYAAAKAGLQVVLKDISLDVAQKGKAYSERIVQELQAKGRMQAEEAQGLLQRILPTDSYDALSGCQACIEAVYESAPLKAEVTAEAAKHLPKGAYFFSNTSTLPIAQLSTAYHAHENFAGLHFFSPVEKMPLVEIIKGKNSSDATIAAAFDLALQLKKTPILVNDSRGFFTSRVFGTYTSEGIDMLAEGISPVLIENVAKEAGLPVGPLAVMDEVSLMLGHQINEQTAKDTGKANERPAAGVLRKMAVELGRGGKRQGKGFYEYPQGETKRLWEGLAEHYPVTQPHADPAWVRKRLLHIQALETLRCLAESVLNRPEDGDVGSLLGFGFPPYTGGALSYIRYVGKEAFIADCRQLADQYGARFAIGQAEMEALARV